MAAGNVHQEGSSVHPYLSRRPSFHLSEPNPPGLHGHEVIPRKGDTATFYLTGGDKEPFEPITPNGVAVDQAKKLE